MCFYRTIVLYYILQKIVCTKQRDLTLINMSSDLSIWVCRTTSFEMPRENLNPSVSKIFTGFWQFLNKTMFITQNNLQPLKIRSKTASGRAWQTLQNPSRSLKHSDHLFFYLHHSQPLSYHGDIEYI